MNAVYRKYVDNLIVVDSLIKPRFTQDMTEEQALEIIRSQAEHLFRIHQENDLILKEILFSKQAETLTAEEAADLKELAAHLFNYNKSPN